MARTAIPDGDAALLTPPPEASTTNGPWAWAALAVAVAAVAGSLGLSLGLGLKACALCFYQRAFALGLTGVLGVGLVAGARRTGLLALPLAAAGLGVALFHVGLEAAGKLECPPGLFGLGSAPQQSLAAFLVLSALLAVDVLRAPRAAAGLAGAVVLGALQAVGSCIANPKPQPPTAPYAKPPDVCRPPFHPAQATP